MGLTNFPPEDRLQVKLLLLLSHQQMSIVVRHATELCLWQSFGNGICFSYYHIFRRRQIWIDIFY